jgi:poly(A) polymerase
LISLPQEIQVIKSLMQPGQKIYLVGGAVRDGLLLRTNQDLDFISIGDPRIIGRKLADKLSGAFFMLDEERSACRVISKNEQENRLVFDFALMRGNTLEEDLLERDFTINAMAVDLDNPIEILDPLQGAKDLTEKKLHPCRPSCFKNDPLRVIRAIRYSVKYDLCMEPSTVELLLGAVNDLSLVSKERKRDELFKIFEIEKPWLALELISHYKILSHLRLENLNDNQQAFLRLKQFDQMMAILQSSKDDKRPIDNNLDTFGVAFEPSRILLQKRFSQVNQSDRSIHALDQLITLLWDLNEIEGLNVSEGLALSKEEQDHICLVLRYKCCLADQFESQLKPDRKFLYRFFLAMDITGLDFAVLTLADAAVGQPDDWQKEHWSNFVKFCYQLIETWFINPEYIRPKPFLTGRDLMFEFDLPQGPRIGQLLEGLREEQAIGSIQNRTQAIAWVDEQLQKSFISR